jgi:hypothetical protein
MQSGRWGEVRTHWRRMFQCCLGHLYLHVSPPFPPDSVCDSQNHLCWGIQKAENFVKTWWDREDVYSNRIFENLNQLKFSCWRIMKWFNSSYLHIMHISTLWLFCATFVTQRCTFKCRVYSVKWGWGNVGTTCKGLERGCHGLFQDTIPPLSWTDWRKPLTPSLNLAARLRF